MSGRPGEDRRDAVEAREFCRWARRVGRGTRGGPRAGGALGVGSGSLPLPAFVMLTLFGAYRFRIRNPVIASGAKPIQSARKRSEERRVGKECVSTYSTRWSSMY